MGNLSSLYEHLFANPNSLVFEWDDYYPLHPSPPPSPPPGCEYSLPLTYEDYLAIEAEERENEAVCSYSNPEDAFKVPKHPYFVTTMQSTGDKGQNGENGDCDSPRRNPSRATRPGSMDQNGVAQSGASTESDINGANGVNGAENGTTISNGSNVNGNRNGAASTQQHAPPAPPLYPNPYTMLPPLFPPVQDDVASGTNPGNHRLMSGQVVPYQPIQPAPPRRPTAQTDRGGLGPVSRPRVLPPFIDGGSVSHRTTFATSAAATANNGANVTNGTSTNNGTASLASGPGLAHHPAGYQTLGTGTGAGYRVPQGNPGFVPLGGAGSGRGGPHPLQVPVGSAGAGRGGPNPLQASQLLVDFPRLREVPDDIVSQITTQLDGQRLQIVQLHLESFPMGLDTAQDAMRDLVGPINDGLARLLVACLETERNKQA